MRPWTYFDNLGSRTMAMKRRAVNAERGPTAREGTISRAAPDPAGRGFRSGLLTQPRATPGVQHARQPAHWNRLTAFPNRNAVAATVTEIPCSRDKIPCSCRKIPCSVKQGICS
jgi:hypothetical protein